MERPVGVSVMSFLPWVFLPGGYNRIRQTIGDLGIQLLPLRGLREEDVQKFNVISFEGPWNCGALSDALKRTLGIKGNHPSLIDIALFGSAQKCLSRIEMIDTLCPKALPIDVPWVSRSVIELSPDMYGGHARNWGQKIPRGVVLDTGHWQRFTPGEAEKKLKELGGLSTVRMVHLKLLSSVEIDRFLQGGDNHGKLLNKFLAHDRHGEIPVVIEIKWASKDLLQNLAYQVRKILA